MPALRIAMWSGPRNISTAMMRSFGSRIDTVVYDEPLYAHYLQATGKDHPGREDVLKHHEQDWRKVVDELLAPLPEGKEVYYQKHMAHHLLPMIERNWLPQLTHVFLIREPLEMLTSLVKNMERPTLEDTGLPQQVEIFRSTTERLGESPPVLDARDVLSDPAFVLGALCERIGLSFDERMLTWEKGPRDTDGVWARYWYDSVNASSGFHPYRAKGEELPSSLKDLFESCMPYYEELRSHRLKTREG